MRNEKHADNGCQRQHNEKRHDQNISSLHDTLLNDIAHCLITLGMHAEAALRFLKQTRFAARAHKKAAALPHFCPTPAAARLYCGQAISFRNHCLHATV